MSQTQQPDRAQLERLHGDIDATTLAWRAAQAPSVTDDRREEALNNVTAAKKKLAEVIAGAENPAIAEWLSNQVRDDPEREGRAKTAGEHLVQRAGERAARRAGGQRAIPRGDLSPYATPGEIIAATRRGH
ncbi:hypothetical protein [Amycolatopsis sp. GM8]|uniref:hypothetical protein n=1 Tax=Amycolatopsis sp. GM8 TaxID=2896530 RepID=UPI001F4374AE|nr:hypothetical protein [Amycolatopsis sp. GM8]